ncbi:glutathione S-transferase family protein [Parvibaculaceae bacterium PLY_AMNH_Bact1]|nr:glutathione S-transferase family protein [Parvibaculaceae bacterium PLY_AMNH_Bact1]
MSGITIFAAEISTFGRIVAMVAIEKGIDYTLIPTDSSSADHIARHPFGKTPAVEVGGHLLIESDAICRYLDDAFEGPALVPDDPLERAEMTKWMSFVQAYMFPTTEFGLVMPRLVAPMMGRPVDEARVQKALPTIGYQLGLLEDALEDRTFIASDSLTLADLYLYCTWVAVAHTEEGKVMLHHSPNVTRWMSFLGSRESTRRTAWPKG